MHTHAGVPLPLAAQGLDQLHGGSRSFAVQVILRAASIELGPLGVDNFEIARRPAVEAFLGEFRHFSRGLDGLTRLLKKATGLSPNQFIREIRLQQACRLLETKQYPTVLEVVYAVGFENASHFARRYAERFGKKPSEYL